MACVCVYLQCKEICIETQDNFLKELRDFGEVGVIWCEAIVNGVYCKQCLMMAWLLLISSKECKCHPFMVISTVIHNQWSL